MHLTIDARLEQPRPFLRILARDGTTRLHLDNDALERLVAAGDLDLCALWQHDRAREQQCIAELVAAVLYHFPAPATHPRQAPAIPSGRGRALRAVPIPHGPWLIMGATRAEGRPLQDGARPLDPVQRESVPASRCAFAASFG